MTFTPTGPFVICCHCGGMKGKAANIIAKAVGKVKIQYFNDGEARACGVTEWLKDNGFLSVAEKAKHGSFAILVSPDKHGSVNLLAKDKEATLKGIQYVFGK